MNGKRLKTHDISEERQKTPKRLLSQCIHYVADNLCYVDSFYGLPDLIAEQIFRKAESLDKFDLDDKNSFHALSIFTTVYEDLIISSLNLCNQYLGVNFCQDRLNLLTSLREIDLTGCRLGDEHDFLNDLGQLQRDSETFWTTTGLFPQEFVIKFTSMMNMSKVELASCNVRRLILEKSTDSEPLNFEPIKEIEMNSHDGQLQSEEINLGNVQAQHLRVVIDSAYDHFAAVYRLHVDGTAAH
ncbi:heat shock protein beta-11 [Mytilus galloprovincialis]|uniref:Heat shock protein beta-11 n=1 Tax=Mytilus galloprovincialis TaxID=29158 RepID=A0A8B6BI19_MYTGA|nr:heat shock protein beta-11 [Mytilus galloprovincialis]